MYEYKDKNGYSKLVSEQFLLTNVQLKVLPELFGLLGLPHYALIDYNGKIADKNAPPLI